MLLLSCCSLQGEREKHELAYLPDVKCGASSNEKHESLMDVSLQWATSGSGEERDDAKREEKIYKWRQLGSGMG